MEFEDILLQIGGFGKFQRNLTIFFLIPISCLIPWFWMNLIFMLSVPQHWCYVPELTSSNLSITQQRTLISPPSDPSCSMYNINYTAFLEEAIFMVPNDSQIVPCSAGWQYDTGNYESTAATKWDMVCDNNHFPSLIFSLTNVGSVIGSPIYGFLSDKFGRKIVFLSLAIVVVMTEIASVLVGDFITFAILRTINGSVLPTMFTLPYILVSEIADPSMRVHLNGIINTCWSTGLCILPLIAYLTRSWIAMSYISASAAVFILCYWRYLPESPCWLLSKDKYDEATEIMLKIGEINGKSQNKAQMLSHIQALNERIKKKKEEEASTSQHLVLKYPRLRRNFLILSFCWTAFVVSYSGLTYNMRNLDGNEFINFFLLSVVEFPGNVTFWYFMKRIGRRWTATFGFLTIGFACLLPLTGFRYCDIVSSLIGKYLSAGIVMVTDQQSLELFPTVARSFGIGVGKTISTATTMFIPYIAYLSLYGKSIPFLIVSFTCFMASVLTSFLPETLNENLPQTISDADEFGKDQKFFSWNRRIQPPNPTQNSVTVNAIEVQE